MSSSKTTINLLVLAIVLPFLFIASFMTRSYLQSRHVELPKYDVLLSHVERENFFKNRSLENQTDGITYYTFNTKNGKLIIKAEFVDMNSDRADHAVLKLYRFNPETKVVTPIDFDPYKSVIKQSKNAWTIGFPELNKIKIIDEKKAPDGYVYKSKSNTSSFFLELLGNPNLRVVEKDGKRVELPNKSGQYDYTFTFHGWIERK